MPGGAAVDHVIKPEVAARGALFSLVMELCRYPFSLGYSDIDDLFFNTLGALVGAVIAKLLGVVFAVLVALGPRLGDPDKVVEIYAVSWEESTVLRS